MANDKTVDVMVRVQAQSSQADAAVGKFLSDLKTNAKSAGQSAGTDLNEGFRKFFATVNEGKSFIDKVDQAVLKFTTDQKDAAQTARVYAQAISDVGGVLALTTKQQQAATTAVREGLNAYKAMGQQAPVYVQQLNKELSTLQQAQKGAGTSAQGLGTSIGGTAGVMGSLQSAVLRYAGPAALGLAVKRTIDWADGLSDLSDKTGISIQRLQQFGTIAAGAGVSLDTVTNATGELAKRIGEGDKSAVGAIQHLGLDLIALSNQSTEDTFIQVASAIAKIDDSYARAAIGAAAFGRNWKELESVARGVADGVDTIPTASDDAIVALGQLSDAMGRSLGIAKSLGAEFLALTAGGFFLFGPKAKAQLDDLFGVDWNDLLAASLGAGKGSNIPGPTRPHATDLNLGSALPAGYEDIVKKTNAEIERSIKLHEQQAEAVKKTAAAIAAAEKQWGDALADATGVKSVERMQALWAVHQELNRSGLPESIAFQKQLVDALQAGVPAADALGISVTDAMRDIAYFSQLAAKAVEDVVSAQSSVGFKRPPYGQMDTGAPSWSTGLPAGIDPRRPVDVYARPGSFQSSFFGGLPSAILGAVQGGGNIGSSIAGLLGGSLLGEGGGLQTSLTKTLTGVFGKSIGPALGAALPGIGTAVGALIGPLIGKLFGPSKNALLDQKATAQIGDLQKDLLKTYGSLDNVRKMGDLVGVSLEAAWGDRSRAGLEHFNALTAEFIQKTDLLTKGLDKYAFSWAELGSSQIGVSQFADFQGGLKSTFDVLLKGGIANDTVLKKMAGDFNALIVAAVDTGQKLPAAFDGILSKMLELGLITDATKRKLLGLADETDVDFKGMEALADRYGIKIGALGSKFTGAKIVASANDVFGAFKTLTDQGADAGGVLFGLRDEISTLVLDAAKAGTALPSTLQPWIQHLLETGNLLDGTREKAEGLVTDLSKMGKDAPSSVTELVGQLGKIGDITEENAGDVNNIAQKLKDLGDKAPAEMQPLIAQLLIFSQSIKDGKDKLTTLPDIKFADGPIGQIGDINHALDDLTTDGIGGIQGALDDVDWEGFAQRAEDALRRAEDAATHAATGRSPTGVKEISVQAIRAAGEIENLGKISYATFSTIEETAASWARAAVAPFDDLGSIFQKIAQDWEDLTATPLQRSLNQLDRQLSATLLSLDPFKNDPRYADAVALATRSADLRSTTAVFEDRKSKRDEEQRQRDEATSIDKQRRDEQKRIDAVFAGIAHPQLYQGYSIADQMAGVRAPAVHLSNRPIDVHVSIPIDGRVLTESVVRIMPATLRSYGLA